MSDGVLVRRPRSNYHRMKHAMTRLSREPHRYPTRLRSLAVAMVLALIAAFAACRRPPDPVGSYAATNQADCLPDVMLLDQNGRNLSLASLKGKPALIDFVYTTCHGPCPMLTSKLALIAERLGPQLGSKVTLVSITLDPEHDHPAELSEYARSHGADKSGWLFLTGSPAQIEQVLAAYKLYRRREADGSVTHMVSAFLLGPDGRQVRIYNAIEVKPETVTADIETLLRQG